MHKNKLIPILLAALSISACGGGSGGDTSEPKKTDSDTQSTQFVKPDYRVAPAYSGTEATFDITASNVSELTAHYSHWLDALNGIVFGGDYQGLLLHRPAEDFQSHDFACSTGSATMKEEVATQHYSITYNDCAIAGWVFDGKSDLYIERMDAEEIREYGLVPKLTITNEVLGKSYFTEGYAIATKFDLLADSSATAFLKFKDSSDENEIYFSGVKLDAMLRASDIGYGVGLSGEIYLTDKGKLTVATDKYFPRGEFESAQEVGAQYRMSSNNAVTIELKAHHPSSIWLSDDYLPLKFMLVELNAAQTSSENTLPESIITAPQTGQRQAALKLDASSSKDNDIEPLTYTWQVLTAPEGASWQFDSATEIEFIGNLPGTYLVALTVTDPYGESHTTEHEFKLEKLPANVSDIVAYEQVEFGEQYSAQFKLANDEFDGPFEYKLAYGPNNMSVTDQGEVHWVANAPDFGTALNVNFAIDIINSDTETRVSHLVTLPSQGGTQNTSIGKSYFLGVKNLRQIKLKNNQQGVIFGSEYDAVFGVNNKGNLDYIITPTPLPEGEEYIGLFQNAQKDMLQWLSIRYNSDTSSHQVFIHNELGSNLLIDDLQTMNYDSLPLDFNNDGIEDVLIAASSSYESFIVDGSNLEVIKLVAELDLSYSYAQSAIGVCDVNGDGYNDLIDSDSVFDIKQNKYLFERHSEYRFKAFTRGEECRLTRYNIFERYSELVWWQDDLIHVGEERLEHKFYEDISIGLEKNSPYSHVLSRYENLIFSFDAQWQLVTHTLQNSLSGRAIGSADFDNDGIESLVTFKSEGEDFQNPYYTIQALEWKNNEFQVQYSTASQASLPRGFIVNADDEEIVISDFGRQAHIHGSEVKVNYTEEMLLSQDKGLGVEYVLKTINFDTHLLKRNIGSSSAVWQTKVDELSFSNSSNFDVTESDSLLSFKRELKHYTVSKQTGEVVARVFFPELPSSELSKIMIGYYDLSFGFFDTSSLEPVKIDDKDWPVSLEFFQQGPYSVARTQFIQLDSDPQLELVMDYRTNGAKVEEGGLIVLDTFDLTLESLSESQQSGFTIFEKDKVAEGNVNKVYGRNYFAHYSSESTISLVDKLSNKVIWQSPEIAEGLQDINLQETKDGGLKLHILGDYLQSFPYLGEAN